MGRAYLIGAAAAIALAAAGAAAAQDKTPPRAAALKRLTDCRTITTQTERLACYDREVAALDAAEARKDLVVVDRQQITKTRRTLFGLTLPNLSVFGDDNPEAEGMSRIESKIKNARQGPNGKWVLELEDGARWAQIDTRDLPVDPKPGHDIKIRKAALGSYFANVKGQNAIRVERLR